MSRFSLALCSSCCWAPSTTSMNCRRARCPRTYDINRAKWSIKTHKKVEKKVTSSLIQILKLSHSKRGRSSSVSSAPPPPPSRSDYLIMCEKISHVCVCIAFRLKTVPNLCSLPSDIPYLTESSDRGYRDAFRGQRVEKS